MAALTLYSFPGDFRAFKALIAAQYNGVEIARPEFKLGRDNVAPEFLAKNPQGKVPLLETPQGVIFESNAIARYVARIRADTELLGRSFFESGQVDGWLDFCSHDVELPASLWIYPILGYMEYKEAVQKKAVEDLNKALAVLERHLLSRTFLVGEAITLADIVVTSALFYPFKMVLDEKARAPYPSVTRWFHTCVNQPAFKAVLGDVVFATEALTAAGAKGGSGGAAAGGAKAEKKAKEEKPKAEAKPKEEKKEKKAKAEEEDGGADASDAILAAEPKKADPFAALPKSDFVLDDWKRHYSNSKPDYYSSMTYFWEKMDKAGWSLWVCKYKYNEENKKDFMTSNLVGGFIQRCDDIRRYAFGMMHVLNTAPPCYEVCGAWLLRGQEIKPMLDANPDAEYYDWIKMDPNDEAARKTIADYWCAMEKVDGKDIYDSKVFK